MRHPWRRLGSVLAAMTLTAICSRAAAQPPPVDCSQFNTSSCTYHWDRGSFCCVAGGGCLQRCV